MAVKITTNLGAIKTKIVSGEKAMTIAVTEAVIQYGNDYVRVYQHDLEKSALIKSRPADGLAIWDTDYAKRVYYTGTPSKDVNPLASLMWAQKGVDTNKDDLDKIAQNAFEKGLKGGK